MKVHGDEIGYLDIGGLPTTRVDATSEPIKATVWTRGLCGFP